MRRAEKQIRDSSKRDSKSGKAEVKSERVIQSKG